MKELIKAWLGGAQNYSAGVVLLKQYGKDAQLLQFLQSGITPYRQQRLKDALTDLASGQAIPESQPGTDTLQDPAEVSTVTAQDAPKLLELHRQKVVLHREKDELRARLEGIQSDQERGQTAFRILDIRQIITGIWQIEEYYKQHQRFPENSDHIITDVQNLKLHRSRINGNLRRIRSQLKQDPNNPTKHRLLAKWEAEYRQIKESIKQQQSKV